jgi:hypothetical protein
MAMSNCLPSPASKFPSDFKFYANFKFKCYRRDLLLADTDTLISH